MMHRREFLKIGGVSLAGVGFYPLIGGCESHSITPLVDPEPTPFLTPVEQFFVQNGGEGAIENWSPPTFPSTDDWSLRIKDGDTLIATLDWSDVTALSEHETHLLKTMECILQSPIRITSTGYTGTAWWTGIPVRRLLERAGLDYSRTSIRRLLLTGADGFYNNILPSRLDDQSLPEPLLVYRMNGQPLPPEHGFPVRFVMLEAYGYKNIKWLTEIQALSINGNFGTYQEQGFVDDGIMRLNSRATNLFDSIELRPGEHEIRGFAVSGSAEIDHVEIEIDGEVVGTAEIVPIDEIRDEVSLPPSILQLQNELQYPWVGVWAFFRYRWEATRGSHQIRVRAFDSSGESQRDVDTDISDGQTAAATYSVEVL